MKIVIVSGSNVIHTIRWVNGLAELGHEVHLFSCHKRTEDINAAIIEHQMPFKAPLGYFLNVLFLSVEIKKISPDIVNCHYASGYGTLCNLAKISKNYPYMVSVWGSDVYDFPTSSFLHKKLLVSNLHAAHTIGSTSKCMGQVVQKYHSECDLHITPFGVDESLFELMQGKSSNKKIVIGTIKRLMPKYGIDVLIRSFAILVRELPDFYDVELWIVGEGEQRHELEVLVESLGLTGKVKLLGAIQHHAVPGMLRNFDIYAALSTLDSESFGVAIIEASLTGLPVVVSDVDGPAEVVINEVTGLIVPKLDAISAKDALKRLVIDHELRVKMGVSGHKHVMDNYTWSDSLSKMLVVYKETIKKFESL
ncbi:glycosyltransferase [Shewanella algae]|uniref:glycosyltransferase n=1 Tax=Shewanella algae TaxID=38313 RepID=UPI00271CC0D1|nr:glycosyltransferase [Shewanella algae]MDO8254148.1 glycosyltransferase [Shewanella algae]